MAQRRGVLIGIAAVGATTRGLVAALGAATPARLTIPAEPPPNVTLPPAIAALRCPADDFACAREGSHVVGSMTGWIETPPVDTRKLLSDCYESARFAAAMGVGGAYMFESCLRERRQHTLWLPGTGFRLPKAGWFAFARRSGKGCDSQQGECESVLGVLNVASGAVAAVKLQTPKDHDAGAPLPEALVGAVPVETARETVLLAALAPHTARLGVAITADIPADLLPPSGTMSGKERRPDRIVTMDTVRHHRDRWSWLSPTGEIWASGSTSDSGWLRGLASGRIGDLSENLRGRCPGRQPGPDLQKVYAALGDAADRATLSAMRAAVDRCAAAH